MAHRYKGGSNNNRGTPLGFHKEGWNATLRVGMPHTYERASPELKSPLVVGGYSVDCNRKILHDRSKLQFIDETFLSEETIDVQLDLKKGMEKAIFYKGNSQESFENLLLWVLKNQDSLMSETSSQRLSADILCMRGTLKKICRSPYSSKSSWSILVAEFKGTYYIIPSTSKEGAGPKETTDTKQLWGNKFEQYLKGDSDDILDPNEEYRSVLKLTVGDFSLLYSPEIDCADRDVYQEDHKDMSAFVLVKMCKDATIENQDYYKKFRLSDWWLDNKLTGIPRIVVGSCTDSGIIHSIELMKTGFACIGEE